MNYSFQNLKNKLDFFLRQHARFSRKNYFEPSESKEALFTNNDTIEREKFLFDKYDLAYLKSNSTKQNYLENLYTIDLLDRYLDVENKEDLSVLDIGSKNWFYAKAQYFFFKKHCKELELDGIELDSNRLYYNLYSRAEVAKFHIKDLEGANYIEGDFLNNEKTYDYIIWILPFVFEYPHLKWGLPTNYFQPEKMLQHALSRMNKGGKIFIINQGRAEFRAQKFLCKRLKISCMQLGEVKNDFFNYKPRYLTIIEK